MVFRIRRPKTNDPALQSIENTKSAQVIVIPVTSPSISAKGALHNAQHNKAASSIRSIFKKTSKKKKGKNGKKFGTGLANIDLNSLRAKFSQKDDDTGGSSSSSPSDDHRGKTILSASRPPLAPSSTGIPHIRYRNAYHRPHPTDEESAKSSVVSDDSIYKLMMQELKKDFSASKHAPFGFVPAQTVVRSNKTKAGKGYQKEIDDTLRVLDDETGHHKETESRDSPVRRPLNKTEEMRHDFIGTHDPNMIDEAVDIHLIQSAEGDVDKNVKTVGPLRHHSQDEREAFEAQLNCASDDPQTDACDKSVAERSVKSHGSMSARSGRTARSNRSTRSANSTKETELVSLRDLRGKGRHRKQESAVESYASSCSGESTEYTTGESQSLRKLSKRDRRRPPGDSRSYYSEATGTFDETTLGDTEYEWDNIDSFDSWLSLENELRNGAKDDWFCGVCSFW